MKKYSKTQLFINTLIIFIKKKMVYSNSGVGTYKYFENIFQHIITKKNYVI